MTTSALGSLKYPNPTFELQYPKSVKQYFEALYGTESKHASSLLALLVDGNYENDSSKTLPVFLKAYFITKVPPIPTALVSISEWSYKHNII